MLDNCRDRFRLLSLLRRWGNIVISTLAAFGAFETAVMAKGNNRPNRQPKSAKEERYKGVYQVVRSGGSGHHEVLAIIAVSSGFSNVHRVT